MKLQSFNTKITTTIEKVASKPKVKKVTKPDKHFNIPLEFFKGDNKISIENILNTLPKPIQLLLSNGNNPTSIKSNSSIIEIKTDTGLRITLKTDTINNDIPQCKIYDSNSKTELLNTYKR